MTVVVKTSNSKKIVDDIQWGNFLNGYWPFNWWSVMFTVIKLPIIIKISCVHYVTISETIKNFYLK